MMRYRLAAIATAFLLLGGAAACGSASGNRSSNATTAPVANEVVIKNFAFVPQTITVKTGTTVTWVNEDSVVHTVAPDHNAFPASPDLNNGDKYSHTFTSAGTFSYLCGVHNYMTGTVVVTG